MKLDAQLLQRIKSNDKSLTSVELKGNKLGAEEAKALAEALKQNNSLTSLGLWDNNLGAEGAKALVEALKQNNSLTSANLGDNNLGVEGAKALAEALKQNNSLTSIYLHDNNLGVEGAKAMAEALKQNNSLTLVNFGGNKLGAEGAKALIEALKQNKSLTSVVLSSNNLGNKGAKALAEVLKQNKSLTSVDLCLNNLDAGGAKALAEVLKQNKSLTSVELRHNNIDNDLSWAIIHQFNANKTNAKALLNAASTGNLAQVEQLLAAGVALNYQNDDGNTALHLAAANNHLAIVDLLRSQPHQVILRNKKSNYPKNLFPAAAIPPVKQPPAKATPAPVLSAPEQLQAVQIPPVIVNNPQPQGLKPHNSILTSPVAPVPLIAKNDFIPGQLLGSGSFGVVYQGSWLQVPVAIKKLSCFDSEEIAAKEFLHEASIMANLSHPNIVRLYGICREEEEQAMIMEYMPGGSLENFLKKNKTFLSWETRWQIALAIGKGLLYLHHKHVLHRDLKSANVLLSEQNQAKLCDFGLAKIKTASKTSLKSNKEQQASQQEAEIGTLRYLAPECLLGKYSTASDVYSFGMLLWELASGEVPFKQLDGFNIMEQIQAGKRPALPPTIPPAFAKAITACWSQQPENRPTMEAVVADLTEQQAEAKQYALPSPEKPAAKLAPSYVIASSQLQFTPADKLGEGGFGCVYKGKWQYTEVAIKQLKVTAMTVKALQEFEHETQLMSHIIHPNIVRLYGACMEPNHYGMVIEYLPKGSLYQQLHNLEPLSWPVRWKIALDIGKGLHYLHSKNILHRDLKSLNVLLDKDYTAKISDFGLSLVKSESQTASSKAPQAATPQQPQLAAGTPAWTAPELFDIKNKPSKAADVYSYGIILWELASRKIPYEGINQMMLMFAVVMQAQRLDIPPQTPPSFAQLIKKCWAQRAEDRPKMEEVIQELEAKQTEAAMEFV